MRWIIGIDEVGRGPLAGPVCVCAVAIPAPLYRTRSWKLSLQLTDSKRMTSAAREAWAAHARMLRRAGKLRIGIATRGAGAIDRRGINACISACIRRALTQLCLDPRDCTVLLDGGLRAPAVYAKQATVIRGDLKHPVISLAAVVAKVQRDTYMQKLHRTHPQYGWEGNKGYGTALHRAAIRRHGHSPLHRKSFITKLG